jgi:hypothetical protein
MVKRRAVQNGTGVNWDKTVDFSPFPKQELGNEW